MMFATAALPLTVEPIIAESATSLASRLAWRNGAPRLITFCSDLGIDHRGLTNGAEAEIHRVAALAGQDPEPLLFWTPRLVEPGWFQLGQERIKFTALSRTRTWACPLCLAECPADTPLHAGHPGPWQLDSIRSCARHGCALVPMSTGNAALRPNQPVDHPAATPRSCRPIMSLRLPEAAVLALQEKLPQTVAACSGGRAEAVAQDWGCSTGEGKGRRGQCAV